MKLQKPILCVGLFCLCFSLTGCGLTLTRMSDEEEKQVVLYAAKVVSKFNRAQEKGYSYVDESKKEKAEAKEEQIKDSETDKQEEMSLSEILGIEGVSFSYQGFETSSSFGTQDVAIPDADAGYQYLILKIHAENTAGKDMLVDLLNHSLKYRLIINDEQDAECMSTLSREDLSTYYNKSFKTGATDDLVLLFMINQSTADNISSMVLQVTRDGQTYNVKL